MSSEADLLKDLEEIGIKISSVWDFVNGPDDYNEALPILIQHLKTAESIRLKEGIVRALGVKGFDQAAEPLIEEFEKPENELCKWEIGNTLCNIVPIDKLDKLNEIMAETKHGGSRQMIAYVLAKIGNKSSIPILKEALRDETVAGHAVDALRWIGDESVIELLKPFCKHKQKWIRKAAEKSIKRIKKRYSK